MHFKIFLHQLKRGRRKTALYILLLAAVTAFFVMSVNLYRNSIANLEAVEENYSTIAVMELYGDVDYYGNLVEPHSEEHAGYRSVAVEGYDISEIVTANGVTSWDLRSKYAAYIEGEVAMDEQKTSLMVDQDVIRFKVVGNRAIKIPIYWTSDTYQDTERVDVPVEVVGSAAGSLVYPVYFQFDYLSASYRGNPREFYCEQVQKLNRSEDVDTITLYPGVEYITTAYISFEWDTDRNTDLLQHKKQGIDVHPANINYGYKNLDVVFGSSAESLSYESGPLAEQPFPIQRWEDVQADPELKAYFDGAWEAMPITLCTYTVELTNDVTGVPAYHLGGASLKEGRLITEEEYASGAKVCMISDQLARYQGWQLGDKLDMNFYEFEAMTNTNGEWYDETPFWHREKKGFFDEGEYEIVGIYTQNAITGNSGIARTTLTMPWYTIYVPEKSVDVPKTTEELPVHGARLTIRLENGSVDRFLADMEELGLTEEQEGRYNPTFTFFDQGYSLVQPGLESMHSTAQLLLALSSVLLAVTCVLLAFFFAQNQRQSVGIFRMLGGTKMQALTAVLACALVVAAAGATVGALAGYGLAQTVGAGIMADNLAQSQENAALQAFVLESNNELALAVQADPVLTAVSAGASMLLPLLLILGFVLLYIHKEPRTLLPKGEH